MAYINVNNISDEVEREYSASTPVEHRKKYAQFFTPPIIADLMATWIIGNKKLEVVLEPAFGLGIFSRTLLNKKSGIIINGFEVDKKIYQKSLDLYKNEKNISIQFKDYMYNDWENKYDGIMCNPPYFKFHDYDNKNILNEIEEKTSYKLNGFTNLYALFLLKSIYQLNENGRAAYIIPSELLNSDYGKKVKKYLVETKTLRHVIIIDFEENVFDGALTTASILLFANDDEAASVQFHNIKNVTALHPIKKIIDEYPDNKTNLCSIKIEELKPAIKWRAYYQEQNYKKYKHFVPFGTYGKVVRGIATGANEYFTFNPSKAKQFGINQKYLLPCICKSVDIKGSFFTEIEFEQLQKNNKHALLLNAINPIDDSVRKYISIGEKDGIDKKFLTSHRNPWYALENRLPAPILVSVFNRNGLRFIRNEAGISNLTTFHCMYINKYFIHKTDLLFAYLLTDISKEIFGDNRREYGNGLQKYEPNDINGAKILDLELIDSKIEKVILQLFNSYRESVLNRQPNDNYIKEIETHLLKIFC
ncbi:MAG: N-6 DNA methylase [Ignavibacteria bacterium]